MVEITHFMVARSLGSKAFHGVRLLAYPPYDLLTLNEVMEALELVLDPFKRELRPMTMSLMGAVPFR